MTLKSELARAHLHIPHTATFSYLRRDMTTYLKSKMLPLSTPASIIPFPITSKLCDRPEDREREGSDTKYQKPGIQKFLAGISTADRYLRCAIRAGIEGLLF